MAATPIASRPPGWSSRRSCSPRSLWTSWGPASCAGTETRAPSWSTTPLASASARTQRAACGECGSSVPVPCGAIGSAEVLTLRWICCRQKNPIPHSPGGWEREGPSFEPICEESEACKNLASKWTTPHFTPRPGVCKCSGNANGNVLLPNLEIVDKVMIPRDLKPGKYILGWRWDCEETAQGQCTSSSSHPFPFALKPHSCVCAQFGNRAQT